MYVRAYDPTLDLDSLQQKEKLSSKNVVALTRNRSVYFSNKPGDLPIVIDTGASLSLTPIWDDFIGNLEETPLSKLIGLSSKTEVIGVGTVEFTIQVLFGVVRTIHTRAYYVPKATIRLFSPQSYFQEQDAGSCMVTSKRTVLTLANGTSLEFPYDNGSNLPLMLPNHQVHIGATWIDRNFLQSAECLSTFLSVAHQNKSKHKCLSEGAAPMALEARPCRFWMDPETCGTLTSSQGRTRRTNPVHKTANSILLPSSTLHRETSQNVRVCHFWHSFFCFLKMSVVRFLELIAKIRITKIGNAKIGIPIKMDH
jgi:hypothetical protein